MGFYSPRALIMDAQRHQVKFHDIDIQISEYDYTMEGNDVRSGFRAIYGLKEKIIQAVITERKAHGPFRDLSDLIRRTPLNKTALIQLAAAGAFQCFGLTPRDALWKIQALSLDPQSLFFAAEPEGSEHVPPENDWEKLQREYQAQGYSLARHPLGILRAPLERWSEWERARNSPPFTKAAHLPHLKNGSPVRVAGLLSLQQRPPTAKGFTFFNFGRRNRSDQYRHHARYLRKRAADDHAPPALTHRGPPRKGRGCDQHQSEVHQTVAGGKNVGE